MPRYVAYNADTHAFLGFYHTDVHRKIPKPNKRIEEKGFLDRIGEHTHYNPSQNEFYTPKGTASDNKSEANRNWRDSQLQLTDKYMITDYPIAVDELRDVVKYRKDLREYPSTWIRPTTPSFML